MSCPEAVGWTCMEHPTEGDSDGVTLKKFVGGVHFEWISILLETAARLLMVDD